MINRLIFMPPQPSSYDSKTFAGELCWIPNVHTAHPGNTDEQNRKQAETDPHFLLGLSVPLLRKRVRVRSHESGSNQSVIASIKSTSEKQPQYLFGAECRSVALFMHGTASDIGQIRAFLGRLRDACQINVLAVEYPGYGMYAAHEKPSEKDMFRRTVSVFDQVAALDTVEDIVVIGYSLGCTCACELAARRGSHAKFRGAVMLSPFASIHELIRDFTSESYLAGGIRRLIPDTHFPNRESIRGVQMPVLIVHGTLDEVIPIRHARQLVEACSQATLVEIPNMKHNIHEPAFEPVVLTHVLHYLTRVLKPSTASRGQKRGKRGSSLAAVEHPFGVFPPQWFDTPALPLFSSQVIPSSVGAATAPSTSTPSEEWIAHPPKAGLELGSGAQTGNAADKINKSTTADGNIQKVDHSPKPGLHQRAELLNAWPQASPGLVASGLLRMLHLFDSRLSTSLEMHFYPTASRSRVARQLEPDSTVQAQPTYLTNFLLVCLGVLALWLLFRRYRNTWGRVKETFGWSSPSEEVATDVPLRVNIPRDTPAGLRV